MAVYVDGRLVEEDGVRCAPHSHACWLCGNEFSCRCPNPTDDALDCGGCPVGDADIETYTRQA